MFIALRPIRPLPSSRPQLPAAAPFAWRSHPTTTLSGSPPAKATNCLPSRPPHSAATRSTRYLPVSESARHPSASRSSTVDVMSRLMTPTVSCSRVRPPRSRSSIRPLRSPASSKRSSCQTRREHEHPKNRLVASLHGARDRVNNGGVGRVVLEMGRNAERLSELERLYRRDFAAFVRVAAVLTGNLTLGHEAVQEAFAQAIEARERFRGEGTLEAWLW